jgi:hypothetical protein
MERKSYISLIEASQISKYNPDYLGYLVRTKKLGGKKIGRDWFTTKEALDAYLSSREYVSLEKEHSLNSSFMFSVKKKIESKGLWILLFISVIYFAFIGGMAFSGSSGEKEIKGDFSGERLQERKIFVSEDLRKQLPGIEKLNITTYSLDEDGEVEISLGVDP